MNSQHLLAMRKTRQSKANKDPAGYNQEPHGRLVRLEAPIKKITAATNSHDGIPKKYKEFQETWVIQKDPNKLL